MRLTRRLFTGSTAVLPVVLVVQALAVFAPVAAAKVPANLCTLHVKSQLAAVPFVTISATDCSTYTFTSGATKTEVASYGDQDFSVTVIGHLSNAQIASYKTLYGSGKVVRVGSWGRYTGSAAGAQVEVEAHRNLVVVQVNGHGVTTYPKYKKLEKPLVALGAAVLSQV
jgi:hypothetical protein